MYITAILTGIVWAFVFAKVEDNVLDERYILQKEKPFRLAMRALFLLGSYSYWFITKPLWPTLCLLGVSASVIALLFDGILNLMRGKPWLYTGNESAIDEFFSGKQLAQESLYFLCFITFTILYSI